MASQRFPKSDRLLKRAEFLAVQQRGVKGHAGGLLVFCARRSADPSSGPRLGITVTKRIGSAVTRNRIKRWVREAFRRHREELPPGIDVVVVAKQGQTLSYAAVVADLLRYWRRLRSHPPAGEPTGEVTQAATRGPGIGPGDRRAVGAEPDDGKGKPA